jgi:hypothetical protein
MSGHQVEHGSTGWCAWVWDCLVQALHHLALPAEQQQSLTWLGHVPDELALDFDHAWGLVPQLVERGWISAEQLAALARVGQLLTAMSDRAAPEREQLWTLEGLGTDARWADARLLAAHALEALGEPARHDPTKRKPTSGTEH